MSRLGRTGSASSSAQCISAWQKYMGRCCACVELSPPCTVNALRTRVFNETSGTLICIGQSFQLITVQKRSFSLIIRYVHNFSKLQYIPNIDPNSGFDVLANTVEILGAYFFYFLKTVISPFKWKSSELCKLHLHCKRDLLTKCINWTV